MRHREIVQIHQNTTAQDAMRQNAEFTLLYEVAILVYLLACQIFI
jgi:hypothetical protein